MYEIYRMVDNGLEGIPARNDDKFLGSGYFYSQAMKIIFEDKYKKFWEEEPTYLIKWDAGDGTCTHYSRTFKAIDPFIEPTEGGWNIPAEKEKVISEYIY